MNNSNSVTYRDRSRRYSNPFLSSVRYERATEDQSRRSLAGTSLLSTVNTPAHPHQQPLSRSADRLTSKASRRELRYEEHHGYIPSSLPVHTIQCHPSIDHYARTLNQSSYTFSTHRRSQPDSNPPRPVLPRPYSSNIPFTHGTNFTNIPISFSSPAADFDLMSQKRVDHEGTYGKLSDCHTPLTPVENAAIKAPRRIESAYSQFPITTASQQQQQQQEPVYANTQSLYDNILYPSSSLNSKANNRSERKIAANSHEKKSCASQTQLTWTMATFSSFVDLENQSIIIPKTDPTTLHSIGPHYPSSEHTKRISPNVRISRTIDSPTPSRRI